MRKIMVHPTARVRLQRPDPFWIAFRSPQAGFPASQSRRNQPNPSPIAFGARFQTGPDAHLRRQVLQQPMAFRSRRLMGPLLQAA
jgi:hypothetical protein